MKTNIQIHIFNNLSKISKKALDIFLDVHKRSDNHFYIVPGGRTPRLFYYLLASQIVNWGKTKFILSDERLTHNNILSNTSMVGEIFIKNSTSNYGPELLKYNIDGTQSVIEKKLQSLKPKIAILGLGDDGHTASLFPGNPNIFNNTNDITICTKNDGEDFNRISLTFNYLMKAEQILFLINGKEKANALKECLEGSYNPIRYPAQFIINNYEKQVHIVCDHNAAQYIAC